MKALNLIGKVLLFLLAGCSLYLVFFAQAALDARSLDIVRFAIFAFTGALFFAAATWKTNLEREPVSGLERKPEKPRPFLILLSLVATGVVFATSKGNKFTPIGVIFWIISVVSFYLALRPPRPLRNLETPNWLIRIALFFALATGIFFRFYQLKDLPADLGWDLPPNYFDTKSIIEGARPIFFPANYGREGMFFYAAAAVARFTGLTPYSIRITSALIGVITILAVYFLGKEIFGRETGLTSALLLAVNSWHVTLSRSGYRVILLPLFTILVFWVLARALYRRRLGEWFWVGLFLGLGLWTYKAFVFIWLTVFGITPVFAFASATGRVFWRQIVTGMLLAGLLGVVTAMPLIRYGFDYPNLMFAREKLAVEIVDNSKNTDRIAFYRYNAITSLLAFNYEGDPNSRFGLPDRRQFGFVSASLLVAGFVLVFTRFRRDVNLLLGLGLLGSLMPEIITMAVNEKPNCFRSAGAIGLGLVLAAFAASVFRARFNGFLQAISVRLPFVGRQTGLMGSIFCFSLIGVFLLVEARESYRFYFDEFRRVAPDIGNYSIAQEMAKEIISFGCQNAYVKAVPYWYDGNAVSAHLVAAGCGHINEFLFMSDLENLLKSHQGKILVIVKENDRAAIDLVEKYLFSGYRAVSHMPDRRIAFVSYFGEINPSSSGNYNEMNPPVDEMKF